jgi:hypothetical protein
MDHGSAFLRNQIHNAVVQHGTFLRALIDHEAQADDPRLSDLCARHIPHMQDHQRMLEEFQSQLGGAEGLADRAVGAAIGVARDLADAARDSDYERLIADLVMARQSEDTFKTFREAGKMMGNRTLQEIGDIGERHHDAYVREANRLLQHMFVEHAQGVDGVARQSAFTQVTAAS